MQHPFDEANWSVAQRATVYAYLSAADCRIDGALQLRESGKHRAACILFLGGTAFLARAYVAAGGENEQSLNVGDCVESLRRWLACTHPRLAERLSELMRVEDVDLRIDSLPKRELQGWIEDFAEVTCTVRQRLEPMSRRQLMRSRAVLWTVILVAVMVTAGAVFYWSVRPRNIALHKYATANGSAFDTTPSKAVDGNRYESFGFHSTPHPSPWLLVDLGKRYTITQAEIYGRHDCCYEQSVPLVLEVSRDGEHFTTIATRAAPFDSIDPWSVTMNSVEARYVRLRVLKESVLVLSEIELQGAPVD